MGIIENFEKMLASGKDSALLRFSLGNEYFKLAQQQPAILHLRAAVALDEHYSAAWKLLGKALVMDGDVLGARAAYTSGIAAAMVKGDKQSIKEMTVFLRRLDATANQGT